MEDQLAMYLTNETEKITLPGLRTVITSPIASTVAALDAILAVSKTALIADTPSIDELINLSEDNQPVPTHLFSAHHITDIIDRLRLEIRHYAFQTEQHLQNEKLKDLPF
ncbi:MAG: hypothetical protein JXX29_22915 [Deltaproteobacteria bacterium]|nr:hypothetical protein [Deltaproteobacteria bacterium]MBN2674551.1 hypothetical protein [Deltaproteobacteria bacterium]